MSLTLLFSKEHSHEQKTQKTQSSHHLISRLWKWGSIRQIKIKREAKGSEGVCIIIVLVKLTYILSSLQQIIIKSISDNLKLWRNKFPPMPTSIAQEPTQSKLGRSQPAKVVPTKLSVPQGKSRKTQPSRSSMINWQESSTRLLYSPEREGLAKAQSPLN